jgi:hypothetical protein
MERSSRHHRNHSRGRRGDRRRRRGRRGRRDRRAEAVVPIDRAGIDQERCLPNDPVSSYAGNCFAPTPSTRIWPRSICDRPPCPVHVRSSPSPHPRAFDTDRYRYDPDQPGAKSPSPPNRHVIHPNRHRADTRSTSRTSTSSFYILSSEFRIRIMPDSKLKTLMAPALSRAPPPRPA